MSEKLTVPTETYRFADAETKLENQKVIRRFNLAVKDILTSIHEDWNKYVSLDYTDCYFIIRQGLWSRGDHLTKWKRGSEFNFTPARKRKVKEFIDGKIRSDKAETDYKQKLVEFKKIVAPIKAKFETDNIKIKVESVYAIRIDYTKTAEGVWGNEGIVAFIKIGRTIEPEPQANNSNRVKTLKDAEKFVETFTPMFNKLTAVAEKVSRELPEWEK